MSRRPLWGSIGAVACTISHCLSSHRGRLVRMAAILALCLALPAGAYEGGSSGQAASRIEEDWVIVVDDPSEEEILPQLYVVTTPTGNIDGEYSVFEINNLLLPDFYGGGLQFQTWSGKVPTGEAHHNSFNALATAGETITFTVRLEVSGNDLVFSILNGQSTTWGAFGQDGSLSITRDGNVSDLSGYNPEVSARLSRVGAGRGRVNKFQIKAVRYYDSSGNLLSTDTAIRDAQIDEPT